MLYKVTQKSFAYTVLIIVLFSLIIFCEFIRKNYLCSMKLKMKHIALLVISALMGIFAYQTYWLVGLYRQEKAQMDNDIREAIRVSDYKEIMQRVKLLRENDNGAHGHIQVASGITSTYNGKEINKDGGLATVSRTRIHYKDSLQAREQNHLRTEVMKKKALTLSYDKKKDTGKLMADSSDESSQGNDAVNMLANWESLLELGVVIQRSIHSGVDAISTPDLQYFDKALTAHLDSIGINTPHQLLYLFNGTDRGSKPFTDTLKVIGNEIAGDTVVYNYQTNLVTRTTYRLILPNTTLLVVKQMRGILATSFIIILILAFVFWYLLHTIQKQKTLDEMKSDFTNNMTHELKTPIAVAYSVNDALLNFDVTEDKEKAKKYLRIGQKQLRRLSDLVEQILSMSMERRNTMKINIEECHLNSIVATLVDEQKLKTNKPVTIDTYIDATLMLNTDRAHLSNIITNILDNAVKYSREKPEIKIVARQHNDDIEIIIADNGIGIASDKIKRIFDKFYRVPHGNIHEVKGYGLGLYYVKSMIGKLNGEVAVESESGNGTTFKLIFHG